MVQTHGFLGDVPEGLRAHPGGHIYRPTDKERVDLLEALEGVEAEPESLRVWAYVRETLRRRR